MPIRRPPPARVGPPRRSSRSPLRPPGRPAHGLLQAGAPDTTSSSAMTSRMACSAPRISASPSAPMQPIRKLAEPRFPGNAYASALRTLYDVAEIVSPAPLKCLMETADASHILFGSDYPFSRHRNPAQDVRDMMGCFKAFDGWDASTRRDMNTTMPRSYFQGWRGRLKRPMPPQVGAAIPASAWRP